MAPFMPIDEWTYADELVQLAAGGDGGGSSGGGGNNSGEQQLLVMPPWVRQLAKALGCAALECPDSFRCGCMLAGRGGNLAWGVAPMLSPQSRHARRDPPWSEELQQRLDDAAAAAAGLLQQHQQRRQLAQEC